MTRSAIVFLSVALSAAACAGPRPDHPASQAVLPDVAQVVCDEQGTTIVTPAVRPQPDGVHVSIENRTGADLAIEFDGLGGDNAPAGTSEVVWPIPPGTQMLRCSDPLQDQGPPPAMVALQVQDPDGSWVSDRVDCGPSGTVASGSIDYVSGAVGQVGEPVDLAKGALASQLEADDQVVRGGYPEMDMVEVVLLRGGRTLAVLRYEQDEAGTGWLLSERTTCSGP